MVPATAVAMAATPAFAQSENDAVTASAGWIAWIVVGLIAGWLASLTVNKSGEGMLRDIILGIIGGIIGGVIFRAFGSAGVTGFNLWSILVAFIGAVVLLVIYHAITGQRHRAV
jgi:uncharacterized membrane protein YeaQ/YmgE (transglycosylase-associated protein family)